MFGRKRPSLAHLHGQTSGSPCHGYYLRRRAGIKRVHRGRLPAKQQSLTAAALTFYITASIPSVSALPPAADGPTHPAGLWPQGFCDAFCGRLGAGQGHPAADGSGSSKLPVPYIRLLIVAARPLAKPSKAAFAPSWSSRPRRWVTAYKVYRATFPTRTYPITTAWPTLSVFKSRPGGGSRWAGSHGGHGLRPPRAGYPQRRYARISGGRSEAVLVSGREHRRPAGVEHPQMLYGTRPVRRDGRRRAKRAQDFLLHVTMMNLCAL